VWFSHRNGGRVRREESKGKHSKGNTIMMTEISPKSKKYKLPLTLRAELCVGKRVP
jgi:hypothetical protein